MRTIRVEPSPALGETNEVWVVLWWGRAVLDSVIEVGAVLELMMKMVQT